MNYKESSQQQDIVALTCALVSYVCPSPKKVQVQNKKTAPKKAWNYMSTLSLKSQQKLLKDSDMLMGTERLLKMSRWF
jgi:hypothetical protein